MIRIGEKVMDKKNISFRLLLINVGTVDDHITLNGIAASQTEISRAVKLGQSVDGVKSVHSNLVIPSRN
jgi:osmotically-inducible protein OsmY